MRFSDRHPPDVICWLAPDAISRLFLRPPKGLDALEAALEVLEGKVISKPYPCNRCDARSHAPYCPECAKDNYCLAASPDFAERAKQADLAIDRAERGEFAQQPLVHEGPRSYPRKRGDAP